MLREGFYTTENSELTTGKIKVESNQSNLNKESLSIIGKAFNDEKFLNQNFKKHFPEIYIENQIASLLKDISIDLAGIIANCKNSKVTKLVITKETYYLQIRFADGYINRVNLLSVYVPNGSKWMGIKINNGWYVFDEETVNIAMDYLINKNEIQNTGVGG